MVKNDKLVSSGGRNNNSGQNLSKLKKAKNLAKPKKSKNHLKLSKSKKTILDKSEILINLTIADVTRYLITKARIIFTGLRQAFTKAQIF